MEGNFGNICEDNIVVIVGEVSTRPTYSHEVKGERFYELYVETERGSGTCDRVPVLISERLTHAKEINCGDRVGISGQFRSYSFKENGRRNLKLFVFAKDIEVYDNSCEKRDDNRITVRGLICKKPTLRTTPKGRVLSDLLLAAARPLYKKTDYIPCIVWGRNAEYISRMKEGALVEFAGRIQSREYAKIIENGETETRTAYEVSVYSLFTIKAEEDD